MFLTIILVLKGASGFCLDIICPRLACALGEASLTLAGTCCPVCRGAIFGASTVVVGPAIVGPPIVFGPRVVVGPPVVGPVVTGPVITGPVAPVVPVTTITAPVASVASGPCPTLCPVLACLFGSSLVTLPGDCCPSCQLCSAACLPLATPLCDAGEVVSTLPNSCCPSCVGITALPGTTTAPSTCNPSSCPPLLCPPGSEVVAGDCCPVCQNCTMICPTPPKCADGSTLLTPPNTCCPLCFGSNAKPQQLTSGGQVAPSSSSESSSGTQTASGGWSSGTQTASGGQSPSTSTAQS